MRLRSAAIFVLLILAAPLMVRSGRLHAGQEPQDPRTALLASPPLDHYLEALRQQAGIPGLSAAVVQNREIIWERGFGFENVESRIIATPITPYYVGGLSQSLAAVLLLQCVEQRRLALDEPVRKYGLTLPEEGATLRHVLSHSSEGTPGATYRFDPERYAQLAAVMEWCALGQPYRKSVAHRILERFAMKDSVPGADLQDPSVAPAGLFDPSDLERYVRVLERVAVPYKSGGRGRAIRADPPAAEGITAAGGLVSTVRDLAQLERELDSGLLLDDTRADAWTPRPTADGKIMPSGLGWLVQRYRDEPVVWQYGYIPNAYSAMVIKLPTRGVTLILLANSDGLAAPFNLAAGDVTRSPFATLFLRLFI
jgi:CubicO group peptidase (beta-lactamase class C family)